MVGDVSGHGLSAALLMATFSETVSSELSEFRKNRRLDDDITIVVIKYELR